MQPDPNRDGGLPMPVADASGLEVRGAPERADLGPERLGLPLLARVLESSLDGIAVVDDERRFLYLNPAACEILGYPREELLGGDFLRVFPPREHDDVLARFAALRTGGARRERSIVLRPDGEEREVELSRMHVEADGRTLAAAIFRDVTRAQRLAREASALARIAAGVTAAESIEVALDVLAANVVEATRAVACSVVLIDEEADRFRVAGACGLPDGYTDAMVAARRAGAESLTVEALKARRLLLVQDLRHRLLSSPLHAPLHPFLRDVAWDTVLVAPLVYRGSGRGVITGYYLPDVQPGSDERAFLTTIADQAAVAVENARLRTQAEQRLRGLEALYRADEQLYRSLDLDHVLDALVDVATDVLHADKTAVLVWDARHERLVVGAARNFRPDSVSQLSFAPGEGIIGRVAVGGELLTCEDAPADPRIPPRLRALLERESIGSLISAPIVAAEAVFGVFSVNYSQPRAFESGEPRLLVALAQRAALAIDNARLYGQAQQAAALQERQRLARELHDSVSQALYGIALGAQTARTLLDRDPARVAEPLDYVLQLAEAGLAEMRALIFELRPESLATEGLVAALAKQANALQARHRIAVDAALCDEPDVPLELKEPIYRIAREALHNTVKHARATRIELRLACSDDEISLEVRDNGVGFDPGGGFPGHLGLRSMHERVAALQGTFEIDSGPGRGTRVRARLPSRRGALRIEGLSGHARSGVLESPVVGSHGGG